METAVDLLGIVVTQNTYNVWQTLLALVLITSAITGGFMRLSKGLAKKEDINALRREMAEMRDGNTKENTRIIAIVEDIKDDIQSNERRIDRHIEFGTHTRGVRRNPLDGINDE